MYVLTQFGAPKKIRTDAFFELKTEAAKSQSFFLKKEQDHH